MFYLKSKNFLKFLRQGLLTGSRGITFISFLFLAFSAQATDSKKIDLNAASLEDLIKIIHIGETRAKELISLRPFFSLDELTKIKGIGEKSLEDIKDQGLAWVSGIEEPFQQNYPAGIVINKILPSPKGADAEKEWIEIFNQNNFEVNLSGWQIADSVGETRKYVFPEGSAIGAEESLLLFRPTTKITLNNSGDELRLLRPDGSYADSVAYENAPNGKSLNRTISGWAWSSDFTPGKINSVSPSEETEISEEAGKININTAPFKELVKIVHIGEVRALELISLRPFYSLDNLTRIEGIGDKALEDIKRQGLAWIDSTLEPPKIEKGLAAAAKSFKSLDLTQDKRVPKSPFVYLIALAVAIFSGAIIFILKKKLKILGDE